MVNVTDIWFRETSNRQNLKSVSEFFFDVPRNNYDFQEKWLFKRIIINVFKNITRQIKYNSFNMQWKILNCTEYDDKEEATY